MFNWPGITDTTGPVSPIQVARYRLIYAACLQFNIRSMGVLMNWIRIYDLEGIEGLSIEKRGKNRLMSSKEPRKTQSNPLTEHEKILEENKRLRAEVAFLKKLHALIQKEEAEKKRKH